jgi:Zn-dependent protease with chaperone function
LAFPLAFGLGLLVLLLGPALVPILPGEGTVARAAAFAPLLLLPMLFARVADRRLAAPRPGPGDRTARLLLRLLPALVPAIYYCFVVPGRWFDLADRLGGASHSLRFLLLLAPLLWLDLSRLCAETSPRLRLEVAGLGAPVPRLRHRIAFVLLLTVPWGLLSVALDLLALHRPAFAFVLTTDLGLTIGAAVFVLLLAFLLPILLRLLLGLSSALPEPLGEDLRETAAALDFDPRGVLAMYTDHRVFNALLVGPLRWPRYLVLSDGLIDTLDAEALKGVVAHEVGHARAGHPLLLLVLALFVPLLAVNVLNRFDLEAVPGIWLAVGGLLALLVVIAVVRNIAHRFEHEADVLSAIALGGAEPCIRALQRVGRIVQYDPERSSMLHPSEVRRVGVLRGFVADAAYRTQFAVQGLRLRRALFGALLLCLGGAIWAWTVSWPMDAARLRFHVGDFATARAAVAAIGAAVPAADWQHWVWFKEDLAAASAIAGDGGDWESLRPRLASEGWRLGKETLLRDGPAAARSYLALATEDPERLPVRQSVLMYCEAAAEEDADRMAVLAAHVRALGCPPELLPVFGS